MRQFVEFSRIVLSFVRQFSSVLVSVIFNWTTSRVKCLKCIDVNFEHVMLLLINCSQTFINALNFYKD